MRLINISWAFSFINLTKEPIWALKGKQVSLYLSLGLVELSVKCLFLGMKERNKCEGVLKWVHISGDLWKKYSGMFKRPSEKKKYGLG